MNRRTFLKSITAGLVAAVVPVVAQAADDVRDDSSWLQAMIDATPEGGTLTLPPGDYSLSEPLIIDRSMELIGDGVTLRWSRFDAFRIVNKTAKVKIHRFHLTGLRDPVPQSLRVWRRVAQPSQWSGSASNYTVISGAWSADVRNVHVYDRVLSDDEIRDLAAQ